MYQKNIHVKTYIIGALTIPFKRYVKCRTNREFPIVLYNFFSSFIKIFN